MATQVGITLEGEGKALYTSESRSNNKPSTKRGYKNSDKGRSHQGTAQPEKAKKNDIRVLKERDLKIFGTIAGRRATCTGIVGPRKSLSKVRVYTQPENPRTQPEI